MCYSNSSNFSESRTHRIHGTYIYLKPKISDELHVGKSTISMVWSPYLTFFSTTQPMKPKARLWLNWSRKLSQTLCLLSRAEAPIWPCGSQQWRRNGDGFCSKNRTKPSIFWRNFSIFIPTNPRRVRGKSPTKNKKTTQTRPYDPTKKNINPSIFWHIGI